MSVIRPTTLTSSTMGRFGARFFLRIFALNPDMLKLFSFRDEPNLEQNAGLRAHGRLVFESVGRAVLARAPPPPCRVCRCGRCACTQSGLRGHTAWSRCISSAVLLASNTSSAAPHRGLSRTMGGRWRGRFT